jgi:hypothetical protein
MKTDALQMNSSHTPDSEATRPVRFTWADAWVLAAIAIGGGMKGAGLKEIVAAGDLVNRAMFTGPILRSGMAKLMHKGYVSVAGGTFVVAGAARAAIQQTLLKSTTSFSVMQFFEDFLEATPYSMVEEETDQWSYDELTDERVNDACNEYLSEVTDLRSRTPR